jgi:purine-nucleoside phosphorylase
MPGRLRLAPVGLRAALLSDRWPALAADFLSPLVISAGICGALAPELGVGDLLLPESVLGLHGERLNVTPGAHAAALGLAPDARQGLLLTTAEAVGTPEEKAERFHATAAAAVDLESALILAWATRQGCPSLVVRAVSDTARQHLPPELGGVVTPEGRIRAGRAAALFLTHPRTIPHAFLLQRGTGRALQAVARLIAALVA